MSRRLRFQVKPNLSAPKIAAVERDEPEKPAETLAEKTVVDSVSQPENSQISISSSCPSVPEEISQPTAVSIGADDSEIFSLPSTSGGDEFTSTIPNEASEVATTAPTSTTITSNEIDSVEIVPVLPPVETTTTKSPSNEQQSPTLVAILNSPPALAPSKFRGRLRFRPNVAVAGPSSTPNVTNPPATPTTTQQTPGFMSPTIVPVAIDETAEDIDFSITAIDVIDDNPTIDNNDLSTTIGANENQSAAVAGQKTFDWRTMRKNYEGRTLDRSKLLMRDLIFWNPVEENEQETLTGTGTKRSRRKINHYAARSATPVVVENTPPVSLAPKVKVNADGVVVLDEESLTINRVEPSNNVHFETIDETVGYRMGDQGRGPRLTSMSFRRNRPLGRGRVWSKFETDKFYRILAFTGLDFTLMHELFPTRSRLEIKRKYKREWIENPFRIEEALQSDLGRTGPWIELKSQMMQKAHVDVQNQELLKLTREIIEAEDERIEIASGKKRKDYVADAGRLAASLSKETFGMDAGDDNISITDLEKEASKILKRLVKEQRKTTKREKKTKKSDAEKSGAPVAKRAKSKQSTSTEDEPATDGTLVAEATMVLENISEMKSSRSGRILKPPVRFHSETSASKASNHVSLAKRIVKSVQSKITKVDLSTSGEQLLPGFQSSTVLIT